MLVKSGANRKNTTNKRGKPRLILTTKKIVNKKKQPPVPTQRLVIGMSQRKRRHPHVHTQRLIIAGNQRKRRQPHVHVTLLKKRAYVHPEGINMHYLNPSLLQRRPI
jgi:hypothetical protein